MTKKSFMTDDVCLQIVPNLLLESTHIGLLFSHSMALDLMWMCLRLMFFREKIFIVKEEGNSSHAIQERD